MKTISAILLALLLATGANRAAERKPAVDPFQELLQKGLFEEEVNRDIQAAIQAYQLLLRQVDDQRKLAGTAIFRLAECYRKLGRTNEAAVQYERVLNEYADQGQLATLSSQNLVGLGLARKTHLAQSISPGQYAGLPQTARSKLKLLVEEQIRNAERKLAEQRNRVQLGTLPAADLYRSQVELSALQREALAIDGLDQPEARKRWRELLQQELELTQKAVADGQARVTAGLAPNTDLIAREQEVLALKRELLLAESFQAAAALKPTRPEGEPATSEEESEIRRIQAMIKDSPDLINAPVPNAVGAPLHIAAMKGQLVVARFLLDNKANPNAPGSDGWMPLHRAVSGGHKSMAELLLARGADINGESSKGETPLHLAVKQGYRQVVELLLAQKANPNATTKTGITPMHELAAQNRGPSAVPVAELLLKAGAAPDPKNNFGMTPLYTAVVSMNQPVAALLLEKKADPNVQVSAEKGYTPLLTAVRRENPSLVELLMQHGANPELLSTDGESALGVATSTLDRPGFGLGMMSVIRVLLAHGADPNRAQDRFTPFIRAIINNNIEVVAEMLKAKVKANINQPSQHEEHKGRTPLSYSLNPSQTNIAELLLKNGANPNVRMACPYKDMGFSSRGFSPLLQAAVLNSPVLPILLKYKADPNLHSEDDLIALHRSIASGNPTHVRLLLDYHANIEAREQDGETPLTRAIGCGDDEVLKIILAAKPDVNARTTDGLTPLHKAVGFENSTAVRLLLAAGANANASDGNGVTPLDYVKDRVTLNRSWLFSRPSRPGVQPGMPPGMTLPPRSFRGPGIAPGPSSPPLDRTQTEMVEALRQHGAWDWAPRKGQICLTRRSTGYIRPVFSQGTNDESRYTLFEFIASAWPPNDSASCPFPDLGKILITRLDRGTLTALKANAQQPLQAGDCSQDVPLQWGDLVDIPDAPHKLNAAWGGFPREFAERLAKCLSRTVNLTVNTNSKLVELSPKLQPPQIHFVRSPGVNVSEQGVVFASLPFRLWQVLTESGLLISSSDLEHVRVRREDPATGQNREWMLDVRNEQSPGAKFWVRNGDQIEVRDSAESPRGK